MILGALMKLSVLDKLFDDFAALATLIERAKYEYVSSDDIAMAQTHLNNSQRDQLATNVA